MFKTTDNPTFHITSTQKEGDTAWVSRVFAFQLRGKALSIEGVTRLDFGDDGRVIVHRDYWDATDLFVDSRCWIDCCVILNAGYPSWSPMLQA